MCRVATYVLVCCLTAAVTACGFKPLLGESNSLFYQSRINVAPIPDREGQFLRERLEALFYHDQGHSADASYTIHVELSFSHNLLSDHYQKDSPDWWIVEFLADMMIVDDKHLTGEVDSLLENRIGVIDSFEGKKILFRKRFWEKGGIVTGYDPAARNVAQTQAHEQILERLSQVIYQEMLMFLSRRSPSGSTQSS